MDPMAAATTFATTVSLLAEFVGRREANEGRSYDEFMEWLSANRHDEIRRMLELNTHTTIGLKALLNEGHRQIIDHLQGLDRSMASLAAGFDSFRTIAEAAHPHTALSGQAMSLLEQFYDSGASKVLYIQYLEGTKKLAVVDGPRGGDLTIGDPRFIEDDLATLVELGFLELTRNGRGDPLYGLRRSAARFVEAQRRGCTAVEGRKEVTNERSP